ncbi:hypothetical protein BDR05DRAFT_360342 [Suillus weaverae]|nr:hypothetical protein BDR05DRAFT_360342 [Suillus weaverae]
MWPRRRSSTHNSSVLSEKPTEDETEKSPEAVKIAVMISMPSSAFRCWNHGGVPSSHSTGLDDALRDYQIGVTQVPWIHGEVRTRCCPGRGTNPSCSSSIGRLEPSKY